MRPLSLAALTVLELSPLEQVQCAAAAGYRHVGLRLVPATPHDPAWDAIGDTPLVRATRRALADTGITVLDVEILRLAPGTEVRDFERLLDTAASLGAAYLLVAGNDPDEARLTERYAALCGLAAARGLVACIEPMPWTDVRDVVQAARIVERAGADNAGVLVDPIHFDRAGTPIEALAAIAPRRRPYLQFCDAVAERPTSVEELLRQARTDRLPPGEGALDLRALLHAMPTDVALSLEVPLAMPAGTPAPVRAKRVIEATRKWLEPAHCGS
ncbi:MAG: sugar phosphate isomerase/epimerase family protein [Rhizobacter sp.]